MATDPNAPVAPVDPVDPAAVTDPAPVDPPPTDPVIAAAPEAPKVPEKYELKVPDGVTVDPAFVERTAAAARELGLSNEAGQKLLELDLAELAASEAAGKAAYDAAVKSWEPGGESYERRKAAWITDAMKDPYVVGHNPSPEGFKVVAEKVQQVLGAYARPTLTALLEKEGFLYHPEVLGFLMDLSRRTSEGTLVLGTPPAADRPKTDAERMYPNGGEGPRKTQAA